MHANTSQSTLHFAQNHVFFVHEGDTEAWILAISAQIKEISADQVEGRPDLALLKIGSQAFLTSLCCVLLQNNPHTRSGKHTSMLA